MACSTEHRGTPAIQRLVEFAPASGGLALWIEHRNVELADSPLLIANDGRSIFYGPQFAQLPLTRQTGLVAHQVLHVALRHAQRCVELQAILGDVDRQLFTVCADAIVNSALAHIPWLELPPRAIQLDVLLERVLGITAPLEVSLLQWDVERLYQAIDDRQQEAGRPDGQCSAAARQLAQGMLEDLLTPTVSEQPQTRAEQSREWAERLARAHATDGEFSLLRTLLADLPRTRTPWPQLLRHQLARGLRQQPDLCWSRPARSWLARRGRTRGGQRLPWEPGTVGARCVPRLVVVVDVSGSVDSPLLERFASEVEAITRRCEASLTLVIGDDQVRRVEHFEPGRSSLRAIQFHGGGGTDFSPLLREADRHRPDLAVVMTDLQGPADYRPRWPVLWAVPPAYETAVPPFGRKLVLSP